MGETDEFAPQSSHVEDETVHEPATEESAAAPDAPAETAELDEIAQSLSDEGASDEVAETADGAVAEPDAAADDSVEAAVVADAAADSFDDIVPPVPAVVAVSHEQEPSLVVGQVPWWPFLVYLGAWIALAAIAVWQLLQLPVGVAVYESPAYVMTILGGLIMTAMGPLLILAVWLGTRANRVAQEREGLLTSALMKGALVTLSGALIWWASLAIIDYLRLGRLL